MPLLRRKRRLPPDTIAVEGKPESESSNLEIGIFTKFQQNNCK